MWRISSRRITNSSQIILSAQHHHQYWAKVLFECRRLSPRSHPFPLSLFSLASVSFPLRSFGVTYVVVTLIIVWTDGWKRIKFFGSQPNRITHQQFSLSLPHSRRRILNWTWTRTRPKYTIINSESESDFCTAECRKTNWWEENKNSVVRSCACVCGACVWVGESA